MNTITKYALGAAAAVLVAIIGFTVLNGGGGNIGSGDPTDTPDPTPAASVEASTIVIGEGLLSHARVTTLRPDGWSLEANFAGKETGRNGIGFSAWTNVGVHQDPCAWEGEEMDLSANPTVDEIMAALVAQPGRDPSNPTRTSLGGWPAVRVELRVPPTLDISSCDQGRYKAWTDLSDPSGGNWNHEGGQFDVIYVVDVDGGPVIIDDWYHASTSDSDLGELEAVLESMVIDLPD